MGYEKKYKEALERAEALIAGETNTSDALFCLNDIKSIFPELAESEDERIRKVQLDYWRSVGGKEWHGVPVQEVIAWLEKQCEQDDYDDNIITRDDEILQAISVGLTDVVKDAGWSDFGDIPIEDIQAWLEKQAPKPKWTEEDECYMGECISAIATKDGWSFEEKRKTKHWLESLKQRLQ